MSGQGDFAPDPSWPSILELATKLWGDPTDKSDPNDIRFGAHGSKSVDPATNTWKDFEDDTGGGYKALHEKAIGPLPNGNDQTGPEPWFNVDIAYDYRDASGRLIAQNCRMKPRYRQRFMQRQPSGKLLKNGEPVWRWSTKGLNIPLYRTPEMAAADPEAVRWLCEGEKDADNLARLGLIATTNIAGAASWKNGHNGIFGGRHVVILEDNDDAGRKRSARIAPGLIGIAKSVKVLALPRLPEKGDVSDWLDAGGTIEELERLAREAPEFVPSGRSEPEGRENTFSAPEPEPPPSSDEAEAAWRDTDPNRAPDDDPRPAPPPHPEFVGAPGVTFREPGDPRPEPPPEPEVAILWPEPVDLLADSDTGAPILTADHVPPALWPFIQDTSERMGVATSSVALASTVSCSAVISEEWHIQPKARDYLWTEAARLWGAIVGPPSILKSPIIAACTKPIEILEIAARKTWHEDMETYQVAHAEWKAAQKKKNAEVAPEPKPPRLARYMVEDTSIEALQEVLRDGGHRHAPQGKVLVRRDELSEFLASMDRYSTSKADNGAYLRLYNGGRFSVDRIGRGSFVASSWSGCILGGIQPDPIQRVATKAAHDGLLQRFQFDVPAAQSGGLDRAPDYSAIAAYRDLFPALVALHPARNKETGHPEAVALHSDAHAIRDDINMLAAAMAHMPNASKQLQAALGKWPGTFARLCLAYHLIEIAACRARGDIGPPVSVVSVDTARRVQRYMRAVLAPNLLRADAVMFSSQQSEHAAWIAGYILAGKLTTITAREIVQHYRTLKAPEQRHALDDTMLALCVVGWLAAEEPASPAKLPTRWQVNPRVHIGFAERAEAERKRRDAIRDAIAKHVASLKDVDNVA